MRPSSPAAANRRAHFLSVGRLTPQLAGAENMLVSLWPIGDSLGPEWSKIFYGDYLGHGCGVGLAVPR